MNYNEEPLIVSKNVHSLKFWGDLEADVSMPLMKVFLTLKLNLYFLKGISECQLSK